MPFFTVEKLRRALRERGRALAGARVLVLGAAFKKDIDAARNSSAVRVMEILRSEGAELEYHDPHVPFVRISCGVYGDQARPVELRSVELSSERIRRSDTIVVLVAHSRI